MGSRTAVQVGDPAPDIKFPATAGEPSSLADYRGKSDVILFFYPKDNSPACTAEACSFRDSYEAFRDAGAEVIGVSSDSVWLHEKFAERNRLPFRLISDSDGFIRARYGVPKTLGLIPGRATYVIDRDGIVRHIFSSQFQVHKHVDEALQALRGLKDPGSGGRSAESP